MDNPWINCNDSLPEDDYWVLCYSDNHIPPLVIAHYSHVKGWVANEIGWIGVRPITAQYWCRIPQLPIANQFGKV
jgi:hypothetical protein